MKNANDSPESMIATLGVEPQVVTIALDTLTKAGKNIDQVTVVYTDHPAIKAALNIIEKEFANGAYPGLSLRTVEINSPRGPVKDFHHEEELWALLRTLYTLVRQARQKRRIVHLCISGGRKVMGVIAMTVAQLLFGNDDQIWYLITEGWKPGANRRLHALSESVRLIPIPVLRWQEASTLMQTVTKLDDPEEVLAWHHRLTRKAEERRQGEFIRHWLTPAERGVTQLACLGLDNASIAARLQKREQTVANQLRSVYEKLFEWLNYPDYNVDRNVLIARFAPYFTLTESRGDHDYANS